MLLPLLLLSSLHASFASLAADTALDIVINRDLKRMLEYTSPYEITEWVVEAACHHFPELKPPTNEEMIRLKREFMPYMTEMSKNEKILFGKSPSKFKLMDAKRAQLYEIAKREFQLLPKRGKELIKSENNYLYQQFVFFPVKSLLETKIESYEERKLNKFQIKEEIENIQFDLIYKYHKDDPENPDAAAELELEKIKRSQKRPSSLPPKKEQSEVTKELLEYSSIYEAIDSVIDDVCEEHPQLHPGDDRKMLILKREALKFLQASNEIRQEVYAGFPSEYTVLSKVMKKLKEIGMRIEPANDEEKNMMDHFEVYYVLDQMVYKPFLEHIEKKKESYASRGWTKEQIKKDTMATQLHLAEVFLKDDHDPELLDTVRYNILKNEL